MKERNFFDPISGDNSTLPWSPEAALINGYTRWMDRDGCACSPGKKARYLKDNSCAFCMTSDAHALWALWSKGDPSRPEPWVTSPEAAAKAGVDWYYGSPNHDVMCPHGPHLRKTHIVTGRCVECEKDAAHFRAMKRGPRAIARAAGHSSYTPADPCPKCGQLAQRNVITNNCQGCSRNNNPRASARAAGHSSYTPADACPECGTTAPRNVVTNACSGCKGSDGRTTPSRQFADACPDAIMPRDTARALGFTLYRTGEACRKGHTGWRYVSTGNCLECLK